MLEAQHSREAEAATRRQEEVDMTAKIAAETQRRMEVRASLRCPSQWHLTPTTESAARMAAS